MSAISRRAYAAMGLSPAPTPRGPEPSRVPAGFRDAEELSGVLADVYDLVAHGTAPPEPAPDSRRLRPDDLLDPSFRKG